MMMMMMMIYIISKIGSNNSLTLSPATIPTTMGLRNPGIVPTVFEILIIIPAYLGAISRGLTRRLENTKPHRPTAAHMKATATLGLGRKVLLTQNMDGKPIPRNSSQGSYHL